MISDERIQYYNEHLWSDWKITNRIQPGSSGTEVYRIVRDIPYLEKDHQEISALKVVPIKEEMLPGERNEPAYRRDKIYKCEKAANEIWLMYLLRGCQNVVTYSDYKFLEWQQGGLWKTSLAIRMDYLKTLSDIVKEETFNEKKILRLGIALTNALIQCHAKRIVHRDIKPQNIFRNAEGIYLLGDFGISKIIDEMQGTSTKVGTRYYAAPEQLRSNTYEFEVDIYSLGLVLYELCNDGYLPFADECNMEAAYWKRMEEGCRFPDAKNASTRLNKVLHKACAYDPKERYQSAKDFQNALNSILKAKAMPQPAAIAAEAQLPKKEAGNSQSPKDSFEKVLVEAKKGNREAQYILADYYYKGKEARLKNMKEEVRIKEAVYWCKLSADQGYAAAQLNLGMLYYYGTGVEQSYATAVFYFEKAAQQGNAEAQYKMASCYEEGIGVKVNRMQAYLNYEKAAKQGHKKSKAKLADFSL